MTKEITAGEIAAGEAYERLHVPALFGPWAARVADAAAISAGDRVLDVACGTGALAREAARRSGAPGLVAGLDPDRGMLAVAARVAPAIEWCEGSAESLPFEKGSFDAVVSQFGLMFCRDRVAALREMRRVAAPGGRIAVAVWAGIEMNDAYSRLVDLLERKAGRAAADALRAPFALGDRDALAQLFVAAGIVTARTITTERGEARFPSVRAMVEADLRGWLPVLDVHLDDSLIEAVLHEAQEVLADLEVADGAVEFGVAAHLVTARR